MAKEKTVSEKDFENKVMDLAKAGLTAEKIGEKLRQEGVHSKEFKKTISQILKENDLYVDPDLKNVEEKYKKVLAHYESNKQDKRAKREKDRLFSHIRKIKKYLGLIKK